jgi:hypothetical protein
MKWAKKVKETKNDWRAWFAWYPITLIETDTCFMIQRRWLERVLRRKIEIGILHPNKDFYLPVYEYKDVL